MAEFAKVMRQWVRVRKATASNADEENVLSVYPLEAYDDALIADIEKNVMQWAAEHPEPVYPTWGEWLHSLHVVGVHAMCAPEPNFYYPIDDKFNAPIPADIAQKLGLQPKEDV